MTVIYVGLGSNLGASHSILTSAIADIAQLERTRLMQCSSFYQSQPLAERVQPPYLNAVIEICSDWLPLDLLAALQSIEMQYGRDRSVGRWASRTLDLDILLYGQQIMCTPILTLPHYGLADRDFVVYPLYELAPDLLIPGLGCLSELKKTCLNRGLRRLDAGEYTN